MASAGPFAVSGGLRKSLFDLALHDGSQLEKSLYGFRELGVSGRSEARKGTIRLANAPEGAP